MPAHRQSSDFALSRLALATAYWLRPRRIRHVPPLLARIIRDRLVTPQPVPCSEKIQSSPPGLAGLARDLSTPVVLAAMQQGFYAQGHWGSLKWWSPPERAIMRLSDVHIAKRFRRTMRQTGMRIAIDTDFAGVLEGCAAPRRNGLNLTWLTPGAQALYQRLHDEGHAHSVEVFEDGQLVGGVFGVTAGPVFSALSMFHTVDNGSKFAIVSLYHHLANAGFAAVDHQIISPWVEALGGITLPRASYEEFLATTPAGDARTGKWQARFTLAETAGWSPSGDPA